MSPRRVLITGAGGFVGRALSTGFADRGWSVIGLDRAFDGEGDDHRVRYVVADLEEASVLDGVLKEESALDGLSGVDLVVHAAWVTTDPATLGITHEEYHDKNVLPLQAMLGLTLDVAPAAFVFLSSSGVFAPHDATVGLTDAHEPTGGSSYARTKRAAEAMAMAGVEAMAVHVVRLGYLFGPREVESPTRQGVSLVARWMAAGRKGSPLEVRSDDPRRDWTFAPDLAAALERIVDAPAPTTFSSRPLHLGSPHVYRDSELAALIAEEFPAAEVVTVPAGAPVKPPMIPSEVPALRDFVWTDLPTGLRELNASVVTDDAVDAGHVVDATRQVPA